MRPSVRWIALAALLCAACGSSKQATAGTHRSAPAAPAGVCLPAVRGAMAGYFHTSTASIATARSTGSNGMPQCTFSARTPAGSSVQAVANINDGPQPYFVLERTAIEEAQVFTPHRMIAPAQSIAGLGIEADWFPAAKQLMSTDGLKLITISITWRGVSDTRRESLAEAMSRPYLARPHRAGGSSHASGYPSG